jgi:hypothetical protein
MTEKPSLSAVDRHCLYLGKLLANFHSLEFILRSFLVNKEIASGSPFKESHRLWELRVGEEVSLNAFTNYDTLLKCIRKYNTIVKNHSEELKVDETLIDIRDAIAHGRVSAQTLTSHMHLLKFSQPIGGRVTVEFSVSMTEEWLKEQMGRVYRNILKVDRATRTLLNSHK